MTGARILVFGGRGAIGGAVLARFRDLGWIVVATSRQMADNTNGQNLHWVQCDPQAGLSSPYLFDGHAPFDAVCWAQGANATDSVVDFDPAAHRQLYQANCLFVLETMKLLLTRGLLAPKARMVVVSSIWQTIARQNKLSYIMTKAAIGGLVKSASVDLASYGFLINAVLPSAIDTPMTRDNLTAVQCERLAKATGFDRLVSLDDVVSVIEFLCSARNTGVTGQSMTVDLGFSHAHIV
ncbi:MAG: SDR family NAD(P)-dependent oxidoreductase [Acidocella sp.]|nr:SDR family NAD(P)-dependent oxidoreductase [Acidocella sp.]